MAYPDDAEHYAPMMDWLRNDAKIANLISPLHDRDLTEAGEYKKSHNHIVLLFSSMKTVDQVLMLLEPFGVHHIEAVDSSRAYIRYLVHADNADKAQYDKGDIQANFGADFEQAFLATPAEISDAKRHLSSVILDFDMCEYTELVAFALTMPDCYFEAVAKHAHHFSLLLKSNANSR